MNIEKYLILNKYMLSLFGVSDASTSLSTGFRDLQEKLKDAPVGVDSDGRSYFINALRSSFERNRDGSNFFKSKNTNTKLTPLEVIRQSNCYTFGVDF